MLKCVKGPWEHSLAKGLERIFNGALDEAMGREKERVTLSPSEDSPLSLIASSPIDYPRPLTPFCLIPTHECNPLTELTDLLV